MSDDPKAVTNTALFWADYIKAAIEAAEDDGFYVGHEFDSCSSDCCRCSVDDITFTVDKYDATTRRTDRAVVM